MKKRLFAVCMLIVLIVTVMSGCKKKETSSNSLERVKTAGKITVALDDSFPPMEYRDDKNTLIGFDIDFANAIAEKLGVKSEFVTTDFSGIVEALKAKKFDVAITALSITDDRKLKINFSEPYLMEGQIIVTKNGNTAIKSKDDLRGKIVASQLGSTGEEAAKKITGVKELKPYDKITEAFHDLVIGRVDCVVVDELVGRYYITKDPANYKVLDQKLTDEPVGIGFNKDDKELQDAIAKAINDLKADGTMSKISTKWFGVDYYKK